MVSGAGATWRRRRTVTHYPARRDPVAPQKSTVALQGAVQSPAHKSRTVSSSDIGRTPANPPPNPFQNPVQERVYLRLADLIGPGPAAFYRDVCRLRTEEPPYATAVHLIGHNLREVEAAVRGVIAPKRFAAAADADISHSQQIAAAMGILGLPSDGEVAQVWADLNLYGLAHRRNLSVRPAGAAFENTCDQFDALMDLVLEQFAREFHVCIQRVNALRTSQVPRRADIKALRDGVPNHRVIFDQFFSSDLSAQWIAALEQDAFFADPPENAILAAISYARRCVTSKPHVSVRIAVAIPLDGLQAAMAYADLLAVLPVDEAVNLLNKLLDWLEANLPLGSTPETLLANPLAQLAERLVEGGFLEQGERLLNLLAAITIVAELPIPPEDER